MNEKQNTMRAPPVTSRHRHGILCTLHRRGELWDMCSEYIASCSKENCSDSKVRKQIRFPNLAGLCRYLGTGLNDLRLLKEQYPQSYDRLLAIFEDEALNSEISTTLLSAYMKKRLAFSPDDEVKTPKNGEKEICYCFEHDIYSDGE